jgi:hypothetical protein
MILLYSPPTSIQARTPDSHNDIFSLHLELSIALEAMLWLVEAGVSEIEDLLTFLRKRSRIIQMPIFLAADKLAFLSHYTSLQSLNVFFLHNNITYCSWNVVLDNDKK